MVSSLLSRSIHSPSVSICSHLPFWSWQESRKPKRAHCFLPSFAACLIACQICHSAQKPPHPHLTNTSRESKTVFWKSARLLHNFTLCWIGQICICKLPRLLDESGLVIISANYTGNGTPLIDDIHNRGFLWDLTSFIFKCTNGLSPAPPRGLFLKDEPAEVSRSPGKPKHRLGRVQNICIL